MNYRHWKICYITQFVHDTYQSYISHFVIRKFLLHKFVILDYSFCFT